MDDSSDSPSMWVSVAAAPEAERYNALLWLGNQIAAPGMAVSCIHLQVFSRGLSYMYLFERIEGSFGRGNVMPPGFLLAAVFVSVQLISRGV